MLHGSIKFISIGCWNINGLKEKYRDKCFLNHVKGYCILCLQESKFMPESYHTTL